MKLLDTNIVMYAVGRPHPHQEACQRLFQDIAAGNSDYTIDVELLQEVLYVYSSRGQPQRALEVIDLLLQVFSDPLPIRKTDIAIARNILESHPNLSPRVRGNSNHRPGYIAVGRSHLLSPRPTLSTTK